LGEFTIHNAEVAYWLFLMGSARADMSPSVTVHRRIHHMKVEKVIVEMAERRHVMT
jgi:hypothetical protein